MPFLLAATTESLSAGPILMGLLGGLALFLFGMEQMTDTLKAVAGAGLSKVLAKLTKNRFAGAFTGAFVTAVIQSSSVTTVLVVGFITAGLMTLQQSIGVIMGANIGTTITAQIVAFDVSKYALVMVAVGFALAFFSKRKKLKLYGSMLMGLGLVFFGMGVMSDATRPLRSYEPFIDLMRQMDNPLLGILVAALFTALVQSSSATTGIVIVLASQGFITLDAGIALAFGSNIGTCVTAALAALGKPRAAVQAAAVHLLFNVLGVLIWLPLIGTLAGWVQAISPASPELEGAARLAAETPRQIANAHTIFNVANTCLFIWFTGPIARLVTIVIPERPAVVPELAQPRFLDETLLPTPTLALDRVRLEAIRLGEQVAQLGSEAARTFVSGAEDEMDAAIVRYRQNLQLYDAINDYIRRLATEDLTAKESRALNALAVIASHIENISETNAINLGAIGRERHHAGVTFSEETTLTVRRLVEAVREAFDLAIQSLEEPATARRVIEMKPRVQQLASDAIEHLSKRLVADAPHRALLYRLETQIVEIIQREYYFAKKIAKTVLDLEGEPGTEDSLEPVSERAEAQSVS